MHNDRMGDLLTTKQAARRAGVHVDTMRRWIREGIVPQQYVRQYGKAYVIDSDGLPSEDERPKPGPKPGES